MTIMSSPRYDRNIIPSILKQAAAKANSVGPTGTNIKAQAVDPNMWGPVLSQIATVCNGLSGPTGQARPIDTNKDLEWNGSASKNSIGYVLKQCVDTLNIH